MKFLIIASIFAVVCFVNAATKEELLKKAKDLETRIDALEKKWKDAAPGEVKNLEYEKKELVTISGELEKATLGPIVAILELRLTNLEKLVEARVIKDETATVPAAATTKAPAVTTGAPATTKKA